MVSSTGLIQVIADKLKQYQAREHRGGPGDDRQQRVPPISEEVTLRKSQLPLAAVLTPNIPGGGPVGPAHLRLGGHGAGCPGDRGAVRCCKAGTT